MATISTNTGFNSASKQLFISIGRIVIDSFLIEANGTATIINTQTGESYDAPITGGIFYIYPYTEVDGTPIPMVINVVSGEATGSIAVTLTDPQIVEVEISIKIGMSVKIFTQTLPSRTEIFANDFVYQGECCYSEKVFANPVDSLWWKNDKSSFLRKKTLNTDTIAFKLFRNDVEIATLGDNTYGEYYDFDLYTGFILYWELIYIDFGSGNYQVKATETILGFEFTWESQEFCLTLYSDEAANKTFRIETYQTGSILRSGYNYDELNLPDGWYSSYRISGHFGNKKPNLENDYLMTSDRKMLQIQEKITYEYVLQTGLIPASVGKILFEDSLLANRILLTDYNLYNSEIFRRVEVYGSAINDVKTYPYQRNLIYEIAIKEKNENILKRN